MSKAQARRKQRLAARAAEGRDRQWLWIAGGVLVALLLVGGIAWVAFRQASRPALGEVVPSQGQQHIQVGQSHPPYNSDPPTSGWHYEEPARAGFYAEPLPDEQLIHNLEHGHIVISYDCSKLADCETVKTELQDMVRSFESWKVVAVSRQNADAAIALTAWGRIDKLDDYDADRISAFIQQWRDRGPERTPE